ncbi:MAG TPA: cyclopropane-fatty-acyl-phospholipid synthase family protein [Kofleriaceae bacterium]|nr:cyclopropane-fatty-acyl-phospholipid synthase family protein [Kofleriaceae bacterium]
MLNRDDRPAPSGAVEGSVSGADDPGDELVERLAASLAELVPAEAGLEIEVEGRLAAAAARGPARYRLTVGSRATLARLLARPSLHALGRAFIEGEWDLIGDLEAALRLASDSISALDPRKLVALLELAQRLEQTLPPSPHRAGQPSEAQPYVGPTTPTTPAIDDRARRAISYHYDLPVEFWRLWLDDDLLYTCGYYLHPEDDIHAAQRQKLAVVTTKIRLAAGDRVLDLGCGWGGFLLHAARAGAHVTGVTLSEPQAIEARRRIAEAGQTSRCTLEVCDYRDFRSAASFDAVVALGIMEHVGEAAYPAFYEAAYRALRPGGLMLAQAITHPAGAQYGTAHELIHDYVFPEAMIEPVGTMLLHAERAGFEVRDVESLADHYVLTFGQWRARLEANAAEIRRLVGDPRYRAFRAYLAGFASEFRRARLNVCQVLLQKRGPTTRLPLVRPRPPGA